MLFRSDNQEANIQIGQQVPALLGNTLTATGLSTQNITYIPTGVLLDVTPKISPEGRVTMRVVPQVSSLGQTLTLGQGLTAPVKDGKLWLGTWQQIFLLDCDIHARERAVAVTVVGE